MDGPLCNWPPNHSFQHGVNDAVSGGQLQAQQRYARDYDKLFAGFKDYSCEIRFAAEQLRKWVGVGVHVIDIGCGTGVHSVALAKLGFTCTALDLNEAILQQLTQRAVAAEVAVETICGDMRRFTLAKPVDGAIQFFYVLQNVLYRRDEQIDCLKAVYNALKPGGIFLADWLPEENNLRLYPPGKRFLLEDRLLNGGTRQRVWSEAVIRSEKVRDLVFHYERNLPDGRVEKETVISPMARLTAAEIRQMLTEAGFEVVGEFGGYTAEPFSENSRRLVTLTRRR